MRHGVARASGVALALLIVLALAACDRSAHDDGFAPPALADLPPGVWSRVPLDVPARCADGSGYALQVLPGDTRELIVLFQGGGATWGELALPWTLRLLLSQLGTDLYLRQVTDVPEAGMAQPPPGAAIEGATQVVVSYCSGDVHWGDAVGRDDRGHAIEQRGAANVRAALAWLAEQALAPEQLTLVGCSAGAYGALAWAPSLQALFPAGRRSLLLDAGLGVVQAPFLTGPGGLPGWQVEGAYADNGLSALLPIGDDVDYLERLMRAVAERFDGPIGVASTDRDVVQTLFWYLMGEDPSRLPDDLGTEIDAWSLLALERLETLAAIEGVSTFVSAWVPDPVPYQLAGRATGHCLLTSNDLWVSAEGVAFGAWWGALRDGSVPAPVDLRIP